MNWVVEDEEQNLREEIYVTSNISKASLSKEAPASPRNTSRSTQTKSSAFSRYGKSAFLKTPRFDQDRVWKLLDGMIELHIHSGPSVPTRVYNELECAIQGMQVGQRAVVSKAHDGPTTRSAIIVQQVVNQWAAEHNKKPIDVFGGVTLNYPVGGLNPDAVIAAYALRGKYVWLPSRDASYHRCYDTLSEPVGEGGIEVIDENDKVVPALREILALISETDMVLGLGHQSTKERFIIVDEARKLGLKRIEVLHINYPLSSMTPEEAKEITSKGAFVGLYAMSLGPPYFDFDETLNHIKAVGAENIVLAADGGLPQAVSPVEGMRMLITMLLNSGIPDRDIELMVKTNPARLLY